MPGLVAAAGLAEAAWAMAAIGILLTFAMVGLVAGVALVRRSRTTAVAAAVLLACGTLFWEPWHCFRPFADEAYADPDVVSAAEWFRKVGFVWVAVCAGVACSLFVAVMWPRRRPPALPAGGVAPVAEQAAAGGRAGT